MALSFSKLTDTGASSAATSASFAPSNNSLLLVAYYSIVGVADQTALDSVSISGGSLTWTPQASVVGRQNDYQSAVKLWTALVTTGASMTAAVSGGSGFETVGVFQATGHNTSTPIGAIATSGTQDITGSHSYSLSGAPASDSYILSILGVETANDIATGVTAGAGWTSSFGYVNAGAGSGSGVHYGSNVNDCALEQCRSQRYRLFSGRTGC